MRTQSANRRAGAHRAGEQTPLVSDSVIAQDATGAATASIPHKDSVFSLMVFLPELTRRTRGHYCTVPVLVAASLFVITVTIQLALTLIAGGSIRAKSASFRVSLVEYEDREDEAHAGAVTPVDYARISVWKAVEKMQHGWAPKKVDHCCHGADCRHLYPCCGAAERKETHRARLQRLKRQHLFLSRRSTPPPSDSRNESHSLKSKIDDFVFGSSGNVAVCRKGKSGLLDCSPPSYSYLDAWHELDDNGDGSWTLEEAEADRANLGCHLGLSAKDFFSSAVRGIVKDARDTADNSYAMPLVPTSIENRTAMPKSYFEHFKGLVVLCSAFDVSRCDKLLKDGIFDAAIGLKSKASRGGIHDLDSSLDFCQRMLRPNGVCEQSLPHTYQLYRSRIHEKCGSPSFSGGELHTNPYDPRDVRSIVQVTYSEYAQYESVRQWKFQTFLALILFVWYVTLLLELSRIIQVVDMILNFEQADAASYSVVSQSIRSSVSRMSLSNPDLSGKIDDLAEPKTPLGGKINETSTLIVSEFSRPHLTVLMIMCAARVFLWFYMGNVGTTFLTQTFGYDDLLFNCVALAFVFELPETLYFFLVTDKIKERLEGATTAPFATSLPTSGWKTLLISRAFWGLLITPLFVCLILYYNLVVNIDSSLEALNCACFQSGPNCIAAQRFNEDWWNQYWKDTFPLAKLRASYFS